MTMDQAPGRPLPAGQTDPAKAAARRDRSPLDLLPPQDTVRWVARRKAQVVTAVREGVLTLEEACARYALSVEEFCAWQRCFDREGVRGLRVRARSAE